MKQGFFDRRLVQPVVGLLTQGIAPEKIALSLAAGIVLGVFPVLCSTTLLCAAAAVLFRLNLPAIQLANYFVYPLQLLLIVPFIRAGEFLFRAHALQLSLAQMMAMARANPLHAISALWIAGLHAVTAWLLVAPAMMFLLYLVLAPLTRKAAFIVRTRQGVAGSV